MGQAKDNGSQPAAFEIGRSVRPAEPRPVETVAVATLDSLEEICGWLGTFQVRLREARGDERPGVAAVVDELGARFKQRRAELA